MEERAESEEQEDDPPVAPVAAGDQEGPTTALVVGVREEINHALARNHFRDAAEIQHLVLLLLDNLNVGTWAGRWRETTFREKLQTGWSQLRRDIKS